jgi:RNA polymerase sigma-70 factor, ECF subfamily
MPGLLLIQSRDLDGMPLDTSEEEAQLIARAQRDPRAFAPLYARYLGPIYRYCYARLGTKEAAEDATSLVFAQVLAALAGYHDVAFRSWLFTIAHNVVANSYRAARSQQPLEAAAELADPAPSPEEQVLVIDERHSLWALLSQLSPDQRQVVELRLAGLTGAEIGAVLGRNRASVDAIQHRAVTRLRALFDVQHQAREG